MCYIKLINTKEHIMSIELAKTEAALIKSKGAKWTIIKTKILAQLPRLVGLDLRVFWLSYSSAWNLPDISPGLGGGCFQADE